MAGQPADLFSGDSQDASNPNGSKLAVPDVPIDGFFADIEDGGRFIRSVEFFGQAVHARRILPMPAVFSIRKG